MASSRQSAQEDWLQRWGGGARSRTCSPSGPCTRNRLSVDAQVAEPPPFTNVHDCTKNDIPSKFSTPEPGNNPIWFAAEAPLMPAMARAAEIAPLRMPLRMVLVVGTA